MEITQEEYSKLSEDEKRLFIASDMIDSIVNIINGEIETCEEFIKRRMEEAVYYLSNEAIRIYEDGIQHKKIDFKELRGIMKWYCEEL